MVLKNMAEDEKKADELLDELQEQDYVQGWSITRIIQATGTV